MITKLLISKSNSLYVTCGNPVKQIADIDKGSLYTYQKTKSKYLIYFIYDGKGGRKYYNIVNKVSPSIITELSKNPKYKKIISCLGSNKLNNRKSYGRKSYGRKSPRRKSPRRKSSKRKSSKRKSSRRKSSKRRK